MSDLTSIERTTTTEHSALSSKNASATAQNAHRHTVVPALIPLYTSAWGNNPPPRLRISNYTKAGTVTPPGGLTTIWERTQEDLAFNTIIKSTKPPGGLEPIRSQAYGHALGVTHVISNTSTPPKFEQAEPEQVDKQWRARVKKPLPRLLKR